MKISPILSQILRQKWAIDPLYASQQGAVVSALMSGGELTDRERMMENLPQVAMRSDGSNKVVSYYNWDEAPQKSVALINIKGELMKDNNCGTPGMATLGRRIQQADQDPRFVGIILVIDSPGGTIDGTEVLGSIVKATEKPTLTYIDGLMASAAAWVGTSADEVWASTEHAEVGSIGVVMSFLDALPYYEKQGYKFHMITASTSSEKNKMFQDVREGKYEEYQKEVLDVLDEQFMNTVKENRPNVKDEHLKGKVYFAKNVMGAFVDQIGTFDEAVERVYEMSDTQNAGKVVEEEEEDDSNEITINANNTMENLTLLMAAMGVESLESADGSVSLNEEQLTAIEAALQSAADAKTSLEDQVKKLTTSLQEEKDARANDTQTIQEKDEANKSLRSENESLKKAAAGGAAVTTKNDKTGEDKKEKVDGLVTSEDKSFAENLDSLSEELESM